MPEPLETRRVSTAPERLTIEWAGGGVSEFSSLWLLDNRAEDRDPHSGQRLIDVADLPESPRIRSARISDGVLRIEWEGQAPSAEDVKKLNEAVSKLMTKIESKESAK